MGPFGISEREALTVNGHGPPSASERWAGFSQPPANVTWDPTHRESAQRSRLCKPDRSWPPRSPAPSRLRHAPRRTSGDPTPSCPHSSCRVCPGRPPALRAMLTPLPRCPFHPLPNQCNHRPHSKLASLRAAVITVHVREKTLLSWKAFCILCALCCINVRRPAH